MCKSSITRLWRSTQGYSLIDQMLTLGLIVTIAAVAVPQLTNAVENQRLGIEARAVERELQLARLKAVATNRPMRVRFNCPSTGKYRRVELIGSVNNPNSGDDDDSQAARRCDTLLYPYPAADNDPITRPNSDGPVQTLNPNVSFGSTQTLEFWPNGTVHVYSSTNGQPWPQIGTDPVNILLTKGTTTRAITVNSLGKTQIQ